MEMSIKIADACAQQYISVNYDLAITNKAYRIQAENSPTFDRLFIRIGSFHVELSFYKAVGKYIEGSGIPVLFQQSGLVAEGSLNGILTGKNYNRCKRVHDIAHVGFKILHFKEFLKRHNSTELKTTTMELIKLLDDERLLGLNAISLELKELLQHYDVFCKQTLNGDHGFTAKYTFTYVQFIDYLKLFQRSIRTNDVALYEYSLYQINAIFFSFDHHNYARWLVVYRSNLANIENTHNGMKQQLENGALSVRRTEKNFARTAVDITLEQTINANASNRLTGITSFTNSISARQRWSETHGIRMSIESNFYDSIGFKKYDKETDTSYKTKKFNTKLNNFILSVEDAINPFEVDLDPTKLFNLCTGKAASQQTEKFLLNVVENGFQQMKSFSEGCNDNKSYFQKPIRKNKPKTFASEIKKKKTPPMLKQINEIRIERNIISQMLYIAQHNELDLTNVFSYPLTTTPHSLSHYDGSIYTYVNKADLITLFQSKETERLILPTNIGK